LAFLGIIGVAGIAAGLIWRHPGAAVDLATGTYLDPSRELPDFSLIDHHGRKFGPENLRGHWSMLFFGYTNCPDFCPATLTMLAAMEKGLRASAAPVRPRVIFVSVDSKRDTPAQLAQYVPNFDSEFIGLTSLNPMDIEALAKKIGVAAVIAPHADASYTVDHSAAIFVLDSKGRLTAILTGPFTVEDLQADFQRIVAAHT
jgi:protein SCO1/2